MTAVATQTQWLYLERDPKSNYWQLSVKGRRIKARTLYGQYASRTEPRTVEQIAEDYGLPVDAVKEAIAYCESNPPELYYDTCYDIALEAAAGMFDPEYRRTGKKRQLSIEEKSQIRRACYPDEA